MSLSGGPEFPGRARARARARKRRRRRRRGRTKAPDVMTLLFAGLILPSVLLIATVTATAAAGGGNLVEAARRQQQEEEVELLRPSQVAAAAATTTTSKQISAATATTSNASKAKPAISTHQKPHIYRIRAAPLNGNLAPPIRVFPSNQSTFGARSSSSTIKTSANLQQQQQQHPHEEGCAKSSQQLDEQESTASSSSISATSQVLRFLNNNSNNDNNNNNNNNIIINNIGNGNGNGRNSSSVVQRLGEIEESQAAPRQPSSILLGSRSRENDQRQPTSTSTTTTTANSILNLIDEYDSKIITNKTRAQLSCDSGEMILRLNFSEPFKGIVYPDNNRLSPCRFFGDGHHNYELRLPLRGCGTKQVAQRVFVNDVIVRFHRSLELEEDEVKTLICRYPPPLSSAPPLPSQDRLPSLRDHRHHQQQQQQDGQNQFEFIDQNHHQPATRQQQQQQQNGRQPGELSDNLLATPPGGGHQSYGGTVQELVPPSAYGDRPGGGSNLFVTRSPNNRPSADLIDQRSSDLAASLNNQPTRTTGSGGLAGYFERLSSIELLFLISSLMFLVLLALGLAGGYFCFRRQAASQRQASAILRRKRRFLGSSGMLGPPPATAGLLHQPPPPHLRHHYYRQHHPRHHHHPAAPPSTSSPESDLSGRGLLATASSRAADEQYMFNNQAFVPDSMMVGGGSGGGGNNRSSRRIGAPQLPPKPVIGRRGDPSGIYARHQLAPGGRSHLSHLRAQPHRHHLYSMNDVSASGDARYGRSAGIGPVHRAQQVHVEHGEEEPRELSRAKSLTCVPNLQPETLNRRRRLELDQPIGGTLSRYQRKGHHLPHHRHLRQQHYLAPLTASGGGGRRLASIRDSRPEQSPDAWLHVSSDSELESSNNNNNISSNNNNNNSNTGSSQRQGGPKSSSKLFLKSIEDSYITKFTEIEEKEYMKRDSMRPLGLTEWREQIAEQQRKQQQQQQHRPTNKESEHGDRGSSYKSSSSTTSVDLPPEPPALKTGALDSPEPDYRSTNTNLRSLTELDVHFAKSLLRAAPPNQSQHQQQPNPKPENRRDNQDDDADDEDLVVSPEYDLSNRLELTSEPTGADASRNSVSYV